jgi:hypothetical protein
MVTVAQMVYAMDGQPFLYVNKEVDPGLIATLRIRGWGWRPILALPLSCGTALT